MDMSDIERILKTGRSVLDEEVQAVTSEEMQAVEKKLGFSFPSSYCEFVALGGLGERRINHSVLTPQEIIENLRYVDSTLYIPFADNGCGDLYCWPRTEKDEPEVVFVDHESEKASTDAKSFVEWLEKNRF